MKLRPKESQFYLCTIRWYILDQGQFIAKRGKWEKRGSEAWSWSILGLIILSTIFFRVGEPLSVGVEFLAIELMQETLQTLMGGCTCVSTKFHSSKSKSSLWFIFTQWWLASRGTYFADNGNFHGTTSSCVLLAEKVGLLVELVISINTIIIIIVYIIDYNQLSSYYNNSTLKIRSGGMLTPLWTHPGHCATVSDSKCDPLKRSRDFSKENTVKIAYFVHWNIRKKRTYPNTVINSQTTARKTQDYESHIDFLLQLTEKNNSPSNAREFLQRAWIS